MTAAAGFSVVVPVCNEAALLPRTVPGLLDGLEGCALVFVCNGCTDDSAAILRQLAGPRAEVIELAETGKPAAIRAGEAATDRFPRFYLDADVWVSGRDLTALAAEMELGGWELVAPRLSADLEGASWAASRVTRAWMATPHMREDGFHCLLGVSAGGRARWGAFPDLINDDDFIVSRIPPRRRRIVPQVTVTIRPPLSFRSWVRVRRRWLRGQRQMVRLGLVPPRTHGQRRALLASARTRDLPGTACYLAARLLAALPWPGDGGGWYRDDTSRNR